MRVVYRPRALTDIEGIALYTRVEWGHAQAVLYVTMLRETCERVLVLPDMRRFARPVAERPGVFRWRAERHVVYFQVDDEADALDVVRILHDRQLPKRHL